MRTGKLLLGLALCLDLLNFSLTSAQSTGYVKQIITGNSGKFEFTPPYTDWVTIQSFNPETSGVNVFNTIYTQSVQSLVITGGVAFMAAQDSIVKYDLNTMQRITAVRDSGLNQMILFNGKLIVSKQYPITNFFVEVLDTATLGIVAEIPGISGDCGGIATASDTVYVAVNGGWMGTTGKLAVINSSSWTLNTEVDFGPEAIGIFNLYDYQGKIVSVNRTPYGVIDTGSVTIYNPIDRSFTNVLLTHIVSSGAGVKDSLLYLGLDYGIGTFNLNELVIQDTLVVSDPGSSFFTFILSATVDTIDGRIYANIGDYITPGYCLVSALNGDSITTFSTGISSDAIAVDYRTYPAGIPDISAAPALMNLFPNPVLNDLTVTFNGLPDVSRLLVTDIRGSVMINQVTGSPKDISFSIPCHYLPPGMYYLILETSKGKFARPFVKQ